MSRLNRFIAKPITLKIGSEEFEIYPLTMKSMDIMMNMASENSDVKANAFKQMMALTLKKAVPDATQEEIDGFSMKYFQELTDAIMKANGLEDAGHRVKSKEIKGKEIE